MNFCFVNTIPDSTQLNLELTMKNYDILICKKNNYYNLKVNNNSSREKKNLVEGNKITLFASRKTFWHLLVASELMLRS